MRSVNASEIRNLPVQTIGDVLQRQAGISSDGRPDPHPRRARRRDRLRRQRRHQPRPGDRPVHRRTAQRPLGRRGERRDRRLRRALRQRALGRRRDQAQGGRGRAVGRPDDDGGQLRRPRVPARGRRARPGLGPSAAHGRPAPAGQAVQHPRRLGQPVQRRATATWTPRTTASTRPPSSRSSCPPTCRGCGRATRTRSSATASATANFFTPSEDNRWAAALRPDLEAERARQVDLRLLQAHRHRPGLQPHVHHRPRRPGRSDLPVAAGPPHRARADDLRGQRPDLADVAARRCRPPATRSSSSRATSSPSART